MSLAAINHLNRWWIGELLNALLRPVWLGSFKSGNGFRFYCLLNACDCYPFRVCYDDTQLWMSDRPDEDSYWEDDYMGEGS